MTKTRSGPGGLGPEDHALWDEVKKSIKPLKNAPKPVEQRAADPPPTKPRPNKVAPAPAPAKRAPVSEPPRLAALDRRTRGRVARGRIEIDARLDLHGLTLERARGRLVAFLIEAQARGHALVLVITGKGVSGRGALRHEVPHWLSLPEVRPLVIGFEEAAQHHGGAGALYVRVRRRK